MTPASSHPSCPANSIYSTHTSTTQTTISSAPSSLLYVYIPVSRATNDRHLHSSPVDVRSSTICVHRLPTHANRRLLRRSRRWVARHAGRPQADPANWRPRRCARVQPANWCTECVVSNRGAVDLRAGDWVVSPKAFESRGSCSIAYWFSLSMGRACLPP